MQVREIAVKETARFFKVLSDEARLQMLWLLFNNRELCVCDFMEVLEITQSKASRHLAALRNAGLASDRREGLWSYYSLRPIEDKLVDAHLKLLKASLSKRGDAKQLLAKLSAWLKTKNSGETCTSNSGSARVPKNARSSSHSPILTGGAR
ncbi:MAG: transcriptional regulator, ArsR family [Acidobacteria bacterium]|nr:transcriptional regulator, ArsR family [Acidobacteriota bacterium]